MPLESTDRDARRKSSSATDSPAYRFGEFELDPNDHRLSRGGIDVPLRPKTFEVLIHLVRKHGHLVSRQELFAAVWPDTHVTEQLLSHSIWEVRKALGSDGDASRYIKTVPKLGYQFVADVTRSVPVRTAAARTTAVRRQLRWWTVGAAGALSLGVLLSVTNRSPATPRAVNLAPLTEDGHQKAWHWIATDGRDVFYSEADDPWFPQEAMVHRISAQGGEPVAIDPWPGEGRLTLPQDVSPDSSRLLVTSARPGDHSPYQDMGPLWSLSLPAGTPRRVGRIRAGQARFSPDGRQIAYSVNQSLSLARADGSEPRELVSVPDAFAVYLGGWSPDGRRLCYTVFYVEPQQWMELWEVDADGSGPRQLAPDWEDNFRMLHGQWTPDGRWLLFRSGDYDAARLWALQTASGLFGAEPRGTYPLTSRLQGYMTFRPSPDGSRIYALCDPTDQELVRLSEPGGEMVPAHVGAHPRAAFLDFSPDRRWVAYVTYPDQTLWRSQVDGSQRLALTHPNDFAAFDPRWSPDGTRIAFTRRWEQFAGHEVVVISHDGGPVELALEEDEHQHGACWLGDGRLMVTARDAPARIVDLDTKEIEAVPGPAGLTSCATSPDGRIVAVSSGRSGQLVVGDTDTPDGRVAASTSTAEGQLLLLDTGTREWSALDGIVGLVPRWSADGRHLYYSTPDRRLYRVRLEDRAVEPVFDLGSLGARNPVGIAMGPNIWWYGFDPDGTLLTSRPIGTTELYRLDLVTQ